MLKICVYMIALAIVTACSTPQERAKKICSKSADKSCAANIESEIVRSESAAMECINNANRTAPAVQTQVGQNCNFSGQLNQSGYISGGGSCVPVYKLCKDVARWNDAFDRCMQFTGAKSNLLGFGANATINMSRTMNICY